MSAPAPATELKARSARARERRDGITEDALRRVIGLVEMLLDFFAVAEQISDGSQRHIALFDLISVEHQRCLLHELLDVIVDPRLGSRACRDEFRHHSWTGQRRRFRCRAIPSRFGQQRISPGEG
ncbi:hypothetical protein [Nocardia salmonicida]|uniref:hypothetical protein n=1 Tax=Nocardia salmonicida TaxID=53431 RepID=UPI0036313322